MAGIPEKSLKKFAVFDIDGTIFRSSLLIEVTEALIHEGIFPRKAEKLYARAHKDWLERKGNYRDYIDRVVAAFEKHIKGVPRKDYLRVMKKVSAFHKNRVYRFTRDLIRDLKRRKYYLLAISGSPREIVEAFAWNLGFDKVYGRIYELDRSRRFTGRILYLNLIKDKAKVLKRAAEKENLTFKNSIGVGDTEADIAFLGLIERPIVFNPNKKLYEYAKRTGWEIVVERKDVIIYFDRKGRVIAK